MQHLPAPWWYHAEVRVNTIAISCEVDVDFYLLRLHLLDAIGRLRELSAGDFTQAQRVVCFK